MVKLKVLVRHLLTSRDLFYRTQVTRKNLCVLPISMPCGSPSEQIIDCVVVFINYSDTEQDLHKNISKMRYESLHN